MTYCSLIVKGTIDCTPQITFDFSSSFLSPHDPILLGALRCSIKVIKLRKPKFDPCHGLVNDNQSHLDYHEHISNTSFMQNRINATYDFGTSDFEARKPPTTSLLPIVIAIIQSSSETYFHQHFPYHILYLLPIVGSSLSLQ